MRYSENAKGIYQSFPKRKNKKPVTEVTGFFISRLRKAQLKPL